MIYVGLLTGWLVGGWVGWLAEWQCPFITNVEICKMLLYESDF